MPTARFDKQLSLAPKMESFNSGKTIIQYGFIAVLGKSAFARSVNVYSSGMEGGTNTLQLS